MRRRRPPLAAALALALLAGCGGAATAPPSGGPQERAVSAARAFLAAYVDPDGRVVRRDQGGDTVSEGQGYALLLAVAAGDRAGFGRVWGWTRSHLQRPDGLLAYHWAGGRTVDATPAADADLQVAWALALGADRFGDRTLADDARRLAGATAAAEVGYDAAGHATLAAGPWAVRTGSPTVVEPGYWTPAAEQALGRLTGDGRWQALPQDDLAHLRALTADGARLPSDWAAVGAGTTATASPDGRVPEQSGPDGLRALVWAPCLPAGRALVARTWPLVRDSADAAPVARALDGTVRAPARAPLGAVAAAAAASAAGDPAARDRLLERADGVAAQYPTYYGSAWRALGRVVLTTSLLGAC